MINEADKDLLLLLDILGSQLNWRLTSSVMTTKDMFFHPINPSVTVYETYLKTSPATGTIFV